MSSQHAAAGPNTPQLPNLLRPRPPAQRAGGERPLHYGNAQAQQAAMNSYTLSVWCATLTSVAGQPLSRHHYGYSHNRLEPVMATLGRNKLR